MVADDNPAGAGNDTMTGGNGNDLFIFGPGFGQDVITDFGHGDRIQFHHALFANVQAVMTASEQVGADTAITLHASDTITLQHVQMANLHASDFLFV